VAEPEILDYGSKCHIL